MSHELDFTQGLAAIAVAAGTEMPWHGYVREYLIGDETPEEICRKSGLDWGVKKADIIYQADLSNGETIAKAPDNRAVMYRDDTGDYLSVMSKSHYVPAQPVDLVRGLVELTKDKGFIIDCVMSLRGGKVISALARREGDPLAVDKKGKDVIMPYAGLLTSFDGTFARSASLTSIRRVCMNTVRFSFMDGNNVTATQRNTREFTVENANALFDKLASYDEGFAAHLLKLREFTKMKLNEEMATRFFAKLYAPGAFEDENKWDKCPFDVFDRNKISKNAENVICDLLNAWNDSPGADLETANGTLYGAFQAVTYYQDHEARTKADKRWESAFIGNGARIKDQAFELAMQLVS